jgi:hypothetical protein
LLGSAPGARSVFAASSLADGKIVLVAGEREASNEGHEGAGIFYDDAYVFDTKTSEWILLNAQGESFPPRGWTSIVPVTGDPANGGAQLLVFGGLSPLNERMGDTWLLTLDSVAQ